MSRLIDADALEQYLSQCVFDEDTTFASWAIRHAPTVDAVKHGYWIPKSGYDGDEYYDCSVCGESWVLNDGTPQENNMNYCPRCGAKMDGDKNATD